MIANNKIISKLRQEPLTTYGNECVEINAMSLNYHLDCSTRVLTSLLEERLVYIELKTKPRG